MRAQQILPPRDTLVAHGAASFAPGALQITRGDPDFLPSFSYWRGIVPSQFMTVDLRLTFHFKMPGT